MLTRGKKNFVDSAELTNGPQDCAGTSLLNHQAGLRYSSERTGATTYGRPGWESLPSVSRSGRNSERSGCADGNVNRGLTKRHPAKAALAGSSLIYQSTLITPYLASVFAGVRPGKLVQTSGARKRNGLVTTGIRPLVSFPGKVALQSSG